jgi:hypothetical protein
VHWTTVLLRLCSCCIACSCVHGNGGANLCIVSVGTLCYGHSATNIGRVLHMSTCPIAAACLLLPPLPRLFAWQQLSCPEPQRACLLLLYSCTATSHQLQVPATYQDHTPTATATPPLHRQQHLGLGFLPLQVKGSLHYNSRSIVHCAGFPYHGVF